MSKIEKENINTVIDREEIIKAVKEASLTCYGVSGIMEMVHKKGTEEDAIYVHAEKDGTFSLDIHVIVAPGVKVTETIRSLRKTIRFYMDRLYPKACTKINIYADWISSK